MKLNKVVISAGALLLLSVGGLTASADVKTDIHETAIEVISGKHGNGEERVRSLEAHGIEYQAVQDEVNRILLGELQIAPVTVSEAPVAPVQETEPVVEAPVETPAPVQETAPVVEEAPVQESAPVATDGSVQSIVQAVASERGWGSGAEWEAINFIISHESGWNPSAQNPSSTAFGLFQMLVETSGDVHTQAVNGMNYIAGRYGTPTGAMAFWNANNWY